LLGLSVVRRHREGRSFAAAAAVTLLLMQAAPPIAAGVLLLESTRCPQH
jgi:hypothetical protein